MGSVFHRGGGEATQKWGIETPRGAIWSHRRWAALRLFLQCAMKSDIRAAYITALVAWSAEASRLSNPVWPKAEGAALSYGIVSCLVADDDAFESLHLTYIVAQNLYNIYINIIYSYTTSYIHYYSYSNAELFRMLAPSTWRAFLDPGRPSEILELPPHLGSSRSIGIAGDQWLSMGTTMVIACDNLTYTLGQSKIAMENHDRSILNGFSTAISYTIALCHCSFLIPRVYLELQILRLEPRPQALATWWGCRPH